ncbi:MAG: Gfo/Idh/MocA family oxidoreductase [Cyanobacteria bacterium REEB459]|nr:Gfo/Idh/MocA family oxidoreductase [Cyanobacteria bacterium REEB459]
MTSQVNAPPLRVGVMGCSSFAQRTMIPAIAAANGVELRAIASRDLERSQALADAYGVLALGSYEGLLELADIDLVYMPLPTALHEPWVMAALEAGKHLLVEKSFAADLASAQRMLDLAQQKRRLVVENFLFRRHSQLSWVKQQLATGAIGSLKFFRGCFSIPALAQDNFRYRADLGGGALLDAGVYLIKSATEFLGPDLKLLYATLEFDQQRQIDLRGSAAWINSEGTLAQTLWAFDTHYQCTWDCHGTDGRIVCERALTPPPNFQPPVRLERGSTREDLQLPPDNHYVAQWNYLAQAVNSDQSIDAALAETLLQAKQLQQVIDYAK